MSSAQQSPDSPRVIRRYPNRRLYDTQRSAYVSLAQIKAMVLSFEAFVVLDSKTGVDVTRSMLLQLLLDEESNGVPLLSKDALASMIRFYGQGSPAAMQAWFERSLGLMVDAQKMVGVPTAQFGADWTNPWLAQLPSGFGGLNPFAPAAATPQQSAKPAPRKRATRAPRG